MFFFQNVTEFVARNNFNFTDSKSVDIQDLIITVKTTKVNHLNRIPHVLKTWYQFNPDNVEYLILVNLPINKFIFTDLFCN